jgi:hypothetical protein
MVYVNIVDFDKALPNANDNGVPMYYTLFGEDKIQFYPIPDQVYTINYRYKKRLPDLSADADTPQLPKKWHELLVHGALARAYHDTRYQDSYNIFMNGIQGMRKEEFEMPDFEPSMKPHTFHMESTDYERIFGGE